MILILNWKMNPETFKEAQHIFARTRALSAKARGVRCVVAPPMAFLPLLASGYRGRAIYFSAQDVHRDLRGAHTGGVSALQAKDIGASHTIIGHAERRANGETNDDVRAKVVSARDSGLTAIICIGEKVRDSAGEYLDTVKSQLTIALMDVDAKQSKKIIIAYEPVWAIGASEPVKAPQMHEMTIFIRKVLWEKYGKPGLAVPILYGGAVLNGDDAAHIARESEVNGFLLGRASVDPEKLSDLFSALSKK